MELKMRPGTPDDVTEITKTFFDGFSTHVVSMRVFPPGTQPSWDFWYKAMSEEVHDPKARFLVVEDVSTTPPTFAAFAKWVRLPATDKHPDPPGDIWPADGDRALARRFFGMLHEKHAEIMDGRQHWYLELISTKKAFQRRGIGAMLVQWGVDRADEEGWECYLDSTPQGKPVYERAGFRTVYTEDLPEIDYTHTFMVRDAKK